MRRHRFVLGILVVMALTGCGETPVVSAPPPPVFPATPADFGKPVFVAPPKIGEDARAYAARERAGRLTANERLVDDRAHLVDLKAYFGAPAK